jgi:hypothetical protein
MPVNKKITEEKKEEIRQLQTMVGIQESARRAKVSYYTAWCVFHKKYDDKQLQPAKLELYNVCPITGFRDL